MIRLYIADIAALSDCGTFEKYYGRIDAVRQEKVLRYKRETDKRRSLLAGYLIQAGVRDILSGGSGLQEDAIPLPLEYFFGENGKPYLKQYPNICFSLSHSGEYALCAMSEKEIGADIQEHSERKTDIAERFFSEEDRNSLKKREEEDGKNASEELFYQMWAVKEAHMKLTGAGMGYGMNGTVISFSKASVQEDGNRRGRQREDYEAGNIICKAEEKDSAYFRTYDKIDKYSIAVCSYSEITDIDIRVIVLTR